MEYTELEKFYKDDAYCGFGDDIDLNRYKEYCQYVSKFCEGRVFEIGSGAGYAAVSLKNSGVDVVATDIFPENAQKTFSKMNVDINVHELNINNIAFDENSVDNFCMYQVMEHIETPRLALSEIYKSLKPKGKLIIVGPNLISPLMSLKVIYLVLFKKWQAPYFKRDDGYSFPYGDTLFESFLIFFRNLGLTFVQWLFPFNRRFKFRRPCLKKPAISDSDAALLLNPLDLSHEMKKIGFKIIDFQSPRKTGFLAGSTWVVGLKEDELG